MLYPYGCETLEDGQIHSLPMSSKPELRPVRPAASPLAPSVVNHASVELDSSREITL